MRETLLRYYENCPSPRRAPALQLCEPWDVPFGARRDPRTRGQPVVFQRALPRGDPAPHENENVRTFVEVGPSNHLTSFVEDTLRKRTFRRGQQRAHPPRPRAAPAHARPALVPWLLGGFHPVLPAPCHPAFRGAAAGEGEPHGPRSRDLYMPIMSLDDSLVQEVRAQVGLGGSAAAGQHHFSPRIELARRCGRSTASSA